MRIQTIATKYPTYLSQFYNQHPSLSNQTYIEQHSTLMAESFGAPEIRSVAFSELGYEINHVFANAEPMQKRWAVANGLAFDDENWLLETVAAQVSRFSPEILFVADYSTFTASYLRELKAKCRSIRVVLGWCGAPYTDASVFEEYDIVLSNMPELVVHFHRNGHHSYHVNHSFDPRVLERIDTNGSPSTEFSFLGSIVKGSGFHNQRERLLSELLERTRLQIWSEIRQPTLKRRIRNSLRQWSYDAIQNASKFNALNKMLAEMPIARKAYRWSERPELADMIDKRIARRAHLPLFGLAMYQQLEDSSVTLNIHTDMSSRNASNMRLYEATGVGACLLTDWKENLPELFEPGVEVASYRSAKECAENVSYLLDHEEERREMAAAGQRRTLRDHTAKQRAEQIDDIIQTHLRESNAR